MSASLDRRSIVPELLDSLPAGDARALASRRDLVWINALMLQGRIMAGLFLRHVDQHPKRILEIGSGDGAFMLAVARRTGWADIEVTMVDQVDLVTQARLARFAALGWRARPIVSDIFEWLERSAETRFDAVCANLVLHHFRDQELAALFSSIRKITNVFVACEPRRSSLGLAGSSLLRLIGVNDVTMHDAAASVRAGFAGKELQALWPTGGGTVFEERRLGLFTHAFAARRSQ